MLGRILRQHGERMDAHPAAWREPSGLDYSLYKNTKKKQKTANFIIKMEKKKKQTKPTPFFFLTVNLSINVPHVVV